MVAPLSLVYDRSSPSWTAGRSQGFMRKPWAIVGLLLGTWAIAESLLDCCLVAPFAPLSPLMLSGRPLCSLVAPFCSLVAPFAVPLPEEYL